MKQYSKIATVIAGTALIIMSAHFVAYSTATKPVVHQSGPGNGFVVLELFTSEGCSSCPAADALLARIQTESANKPVYVLAYHVDYWDRLGWKDRFDSPLYSSRQYQYHHWLSGDVYTPQVVINGRTTCVGSNEPALRKAINEQLNTAAHVSLNISGQLNANTLHLSYNITGSSDKCQLLIAVVQKHASSSIKAGENAGRTLSHAQIVRQLNAVDSKAGKPGTMQLQLPAGFNTTDWEVIALVQNPGTGQIEAAGRVATKG